MVMVMKTFCSDCEVPTPDSLGYCSVCGGKLMKIPVPDDPPPPPPSTKKLKAAPKRELATYDVDVEDPNSFEGRALAELNSLLEEIAGVEVLKPQALKLWAALSAYGVQDLPTLPWAPHHGVTGHCAHCGRQFQNSAQYRYEGGYQVCRGRCYTANEGVSP